MMGRLGKNVGPFKTNLIKHGEVAVCGENAGEDPITEVSISHITSWAYA